MVSRLACCVLAFHLAILLVIGIVLLLVHWGLCGNDTVLREAIWALCFGGLGGTLAAARTVVRAIRHDDYDPKRAPWQITTPIFSCVFAGVSMVFLKAGVISLTPGAKPAEPQYSWFLMVYSFVVGFATELFVKRLIKAAESLLGETGGIENGDGENAGSH